jgi:hypothetical protein
VDQLAGVMESPKEVRALYDELEDLADAATSALLVSTRKHTDDVNCNGAARFLLSG